MTVPFAPPEPPYVAVIFTSTQTAHVDGYTETAERMEQVAAEQPGYLGIDSARDPESGLGITVSYWRTEDAARAWKRVAEHLEAQRTGQARWYERYAVHIATVTRAYKFDRREDEHDARIVAERMATGDEDIPLDDVEAEILGGAQAQAQAQAQARAGREAR